MNNKILFSTLMLIIILALGCEQKEDLQLNNYTPEVKTSFTEEEAITIASSLFNSGSTTKSTNVKEVEKVEEIYDNQKKSHAYLLNYKDGGFAIISKSNNNLPILAYSTTNNMALDEMPIHFKESIINSSNWEPIDGTLTTSPLPDKNPNVHDRRLNSPGADLPEWDADIMTSVSDNPEGSLILDKHWDESELDPNPVHILHPIGYELKKIVPIVRPLTNTQFTQNWPYNQFTPPGQNCSHTLVGCTAVALGTILHYWKYPNNYQWGYMFDDYGYGYNDESGAHYVAMMLADVAEKINSNFGCDKTGAYASNAEKYLLDAGYKSALNREIYNSEKIYNDLDNDRPVFVYGLDLENGGHAFVADGYCRHIVSFKYKFDNSPMVRIGLCQRLYTHIKWGWSSDARDGYFANFLVAGYEFTHSKGMIINIEPSTVQY